MSDPITVLQHLETALRRACSFDRNDRVPPAALLWADKDSEWRDVVARLATTAHIVTLGEYDGERTGPAIWVRCVVDRTLGDVPAGDVPIVYVPGYERSDLRAIEECPAELQPIAELQYRGAFFGSPAGRDWTTTAFFSNGEDGLGVEIGRDADSEAAFARVLPMLLDEPVASLRSQAPLRAAYLGALLDPDPVKTLLRWLDEPASLLGLDDASREEFVRVAQRGYGFSPAEDGPIAAAALLGARKGSWGTVWDRFAENAARYPGVIERLRQARPTDVLVVDHRGSWPQDNEDAESTLRLALAALAGRSIDEVRNALRQLEIDHGERRQWVWAGLGQAPLASALRHLTVLANETQGQLSGDTPSHIADDYANRGWRVDDASLSAIAAVEATADRQAVEGAVAALYRPWADVGARRFQDAAVVHGTAEFGREQTMPGPGECVLFTDGLRFDLGSRLSRRLHEHGAEAELTWRLAAVPSLTATAKPAVSPAASRLEGGEGFGTTVADSGQVVTAELLRRVIAEAGITIVTDDVRGESGSSGWTEFGNIDEIGHNHGDRFPHALDAQVSDVADRVLALLDAGWSSVRVVTDHGWLYVPGGLDKVNLPEHLTVTRKGRAARLRSDAGSVGHPVVSWRWDPDVRVAVAPGLSCYVAGRVYEHGGLSPQECVTPVLAVRRPDVSGATSIVDVRWSGMRLRVSVHDTPSGALVDVRTKAASAATSKLEAALTVEDGTASGLVVDPDASGEAAFVVVLARDGSLVAQQPTTIGGDI